MMKHLVPLNIPVAAGQWATLTINWPLTEAEWGQMIRVLEAMRPGLVAQAEASEETRHPATEAAEGIVPV